MKIIHGVRGTGKSTNCLAYAWMTNSMIIVSDLKRKEFLIHEAERKGYVNIQVVTISDYMSTIYVDTGGFKPKSVIIDDMEDILFKIIGRDVKFATTSCEILELGGMLK